MLFTAPDMETSMDGNATVDFLEELEGSLKAVEPGALTERFAEGWMVAFPTTCSSSVVLLHFPEPLQLPPPPDHDSEIEEIWIADTASEETASVCC